MCRFLNRFHNIGYKAAKIYIRGIPLSAISLASISYYSERQENIKKNKSIKNSQDDENKYRMSNEVFVDNILGWSAICLAWPVTIPLMAVLGQSMGLLCLYYLIIAIP